MTWKGNWLGSDRWRIRMLTASEFGRKLSGILYGRRIAGRKQTATQALGA